MSEARQAWEEHYGERERVWSGRVNVRLAELAETMTPGRALDLGCGEGADAMWLAEHGWRVTAVDISQTALDRAAADAAARNLLDRTDFQRHDLTESFPTASSIWCRRSFGIRRSRWTVPATAPRGRRRGPGWPP
jgi:2-polyprenyl-3-methyl-5-hydroxy-6-metoxy-1,4-benzoquinol methylase